MPSELQRLIMDVSNLQQQLGRLVRYGPVHEVKKDKLRMVVGTRPDGKPMLSPWLHTGNHRGGATERRFFKKGQNVMLLAPGGDFAQAAVLPYAPSNEYKPPDHANDSGQDEETYQLGELRVKKTAKGYEIWLGKNRQRMVRINQDKGITARWDNKNRFHAGPKGAKIKAKGDYVVVTDGKVIVSKEPEVGDDPIPDDDE